MAIEGRSKKNSSRSLPYFRHSDKVGPSVFMGAGVGDDRETTTGRPSGFGEFIALMAMTMSLVALSIDMMLPAFPDMGRDLGVAQGNDLQLIISLMIAQGHIFVQSTVQYEHGLLNLLAMAQKVRKIISSTARPAMQMIPYRTIDSIPHGLRISLRGHQLGVIGHL